jgi:TldD protein
MSTSSGSLSNALALAKANILVPAGLDEGRISAALGSMLGHTIDSADLYFQLSQEESWGLEDGIVKEGSSSIEQGVGVRALAGERTGFAYSDEIMPQAIEEGAHRSVLASGQRPSTLCAGRSGALAAGQREGCVAGAY